MRRFAPLLQQQGILGMNRRNIDYIGRYNSRKRYMLVDNKLRTKQLLLNHGMPTPQLRYHVQAQYQVKGIGKALAPLGGFAVKPARGSGGKGILVIKEQHAGRYIKNSGDALSLEDIQRHVSNILAGLHSLGGSPDTALVEDLIQIDPRFEGYSHQGIPDIRVIVFQGYPVMAMIRLATHASDGKANLHQGALGVGLDIGTGEVLQAVWHERRITHHPDTGRHLGAIFLPEWADILLLAAQCYEMTGLGYIGTDIVLDRNRGPLILELNARPGLSIQVANGAGLLPRLKRVEEYVNAYRPPQERIRLAREWFGKKAEKGSDIP